MELPTHSSPTSRPDQTQSRKIREYISDTFPDLMNHGVVVVAVTGQVTIVLASIA